MGPIRHVSLASLILVSLAGCTITTYRDPAPPPARRGTQTQPQASAPPPTETPTKKTNIVVKPSVKQLPATTPTTTANAPVVTSNFLFGGPTKKAFRGHAYVIPENTNKMPNLSSLVPFATFYTDRFNVSSQKFEGGFPGALQQDEWFAIRYEGSFELPTAGVWNFRVVSDDGAILYVDGQKVVDNDGAHDSRSADGTATLNSGTHTLRLDYFQAKKGNVTLMVSTVVDGQARPLIGAR